MLFDFIDPKLSFCCLFDFSRIAAVNDVEYRLQGLQLIFLHSNPTSSDCGCECMVNDMYAESSNDEYKGYAQIATQRDFDAF